MTLVLFELLVKSGWGREVIGDVQNAGEVRVNRETLL